MMDDILLECSFLGLDRGARWYVEHGGHDLL